MCELLSMSFNEPIMPSISFKGFRHRSEYNPCGWGFAYYPDNSAQVLKEPFKQKSSRLSRFLLNYDLIKSRTFIAHVRLASVGSLSYNNTHPFQRELDGRDFVFAHNGTLDDYQDLPLGRFKPLGDTDSEYAFCYLLDEISNKNIKHWKKSDFEFIYKVLKKINNYGRFNCIFSDGDHLFCYRDETGYNGLSYVKRQAPFDIIRLTDEDYEIDLAKVKDTRHNGYVIATHPLTNERWEEFDPAGLMVFKHGRLVYSISEKD